MNVKLLKELCEAPGVPGREDAIRAIVKRELGGQCKTSTDHMGSLICHREGSGGKKAKKLMLAAHMDEIGFVVKHVSDKGFLRVHPLGGFDTTQLASQRVLVHTAGGVLNGVLMESKKPKHMQAPNEQSKTPTIDDFFVDAGLDGATAKKKISLGDMVTLNRDLHEMGDLLTCKSMDDRVAVFVMIEAVKKAKKHDCDLYAVATSQEEIGLRGAAASGWSIQPDIAVALDVTLANDFPGMPEELHVTKLGEGTAIKILDGSLICHPKMVEHFKDLAKKKKIKNQLEVLGGGGTDAGGIQRLHGGIPAFTLSIPCRYIHTVNETVHRDDVQASIDLLAAYIEDCGSRDYALD